MPDISVVVAAFSGEAALRRCLESLAGQADEVVAATTSSAAAVARLGACFPTVRFLQAPTGTDVFRLRTLALDATRGDILAFTEDHCTVSPGWVEALAGAVRDGHAMVGGPVENGLERVRDWALFFCEYAAHIPPISDGLAPALTGVNIAYSRKALDGCRPTWRYAFHENEVQDALAAAGHVPYRIGRAWVKSHLEASLKEGAAHLFGGGRQYGGYRKFRSPALVRLLLPFAAPLIPVVLLWRVVSVVVTRRPRLLGVLIRALPVVMALLLAWSAGETVGYLAPAGPAPAPEV